MSPPSNHSADLPKEPGLRTSGAVSARIEASNRWETATIVQVAVFVLLATWGFGGNAHWSQRAMAWWGSLSLPLTLASIFGQRAPLNRRTPWVGLWPLAVFNLLVLTSAINPTFREFTLDGEKVLMKIPGLTGWPSTARPQFALAALWLHNGIYLSCFNLSIHVHRRRLLRALLFFVAINALALAVFGTVQKLAGATGLYFGLVRSPQPSFFASFIYQNHWGAFAVLTTAVGVGLVAGYEHGRRYRDFWHSPAFLGLVAIFCVAASIPLSGSRSCTLLVLVLLTAAFAHWTWRILRRRPSTGGSRGWRLFGAVAALACASTAAYEVAQPVIAQRLEKTQQQLAAFRARSGPDNRGQLYRDTWHMALAKPWFGWGMASYPTVFHNFYNTQTSPVDRLPVFYYDAHSDWLQSVAEVGWVGTLLLVLQALVPGRELRRGLSLGPIPTFLLTGCGLVLIYAAVEFPFGNPAVVLTWWLCFFAALRYAQLDARARSS
jgi:hypothetical protein